MARKANRKTPLPPHVPEEARALRDLYEKRKKRFGLTQDKVGADFGIGSQGNVWQYLQGYLELSADVAARFAKALRCGVEDFSPRLAQEIADMHQRAAASDSSRPTRLHRFPVSDRGMDLAAEWEQLDERLKDALEIIICTLGASRARGEPLPDLPSLARMIAVKPPQERPDDVRPHAE